MTTNSNLVIIPTRSRPDNAKRCIDALKEHSKISDFLLGLDDDDADNYPEMDGVLRDVNPRLRVNGTLNLLVKKYQNKYETITFIGDDHVVRTDGWDELLYAPIKERGYGISYGDDLFQGENLPTMAMISTNIPKALGFLSPPKLIHLYIDNFWKLFGQVTQSLTYVPEVIIEHMHYMAGKAEVDEQYKEVNSSEMNQHDGQAFVEYVENQLKDDAVKFLMTVMKKDKKKK